MSSTRRSPCRRFRRSTCSSATWRGWRTPWPSWPSATGTRPRLAAARREMAVGKISGAVGTHANVPAELEERVCARLGLEPDPASTQVIQRDRHAYFIVTLGVIAATLEQQALQ